MKKTTLYILIWMFVWGMSLSAFKLEAEAPLLTPQQIYENELEVWIEKLSICESNGNPNNVTPFDGGSPSYGYVQFKLGTFWSYNQKFKVFPELTLDNLHQYTMDKDKQITMTKAIITNDYAWENWYNCSKKIGLPPTTD